MNSLLIEPNETNYNCLLQNSHFSRADCQLQTIDVITTSSSTRDDPVDHSGRSLAAETMGENYWSNKCRHRNQTIPTISGVDDCASVHSPDTTGRELRTAFYCDVGEWVGYYFLSGRPLINCLLLTCISRSLATLGWTVLQAYAVCYD